MIRKILAGLGILVSGSGAVVDVKYGITFGPVFNWSFGPHGTEFSYGINAAYWDFRGQIPLSLDLGYEATNKKDNLFYAEIQTGEILAGVSAGPVYSSEKGFGWQASAWGNFFAGANLRLRYLGGANLVTGAYLALPVMKTEGNFE